MPQQAAPPSQPAYAQPEPDLSVKYNVMLGLPPDIPVKLPAEAPLLHYAERLEVLVWTPERLR